MLKVIRKLGQGNQICLVSFSAKMLADTLMAWGVADTLKDNGLEQSQFMWGHSDSQEDCSLISGRDHGSVAE